MLQLIQRIKDGFMTVEDLPLPTLRKKGILVQNKYSLISAGTEKMTVEQGKENLLMKAYKNPDVVKTVLQILQRDGLVATAERILGNLEDFKTLGYSAAGIVIESASEKFKPGDRVAVAGAGYANHAEVVFIPENLATKIPDNVSFEEAAFTTVGAIALQGVRQADPKLGDTVAVVGLGLIGLITVHLLQANGCKVIGMDISDEALEFALKYGCDYVLKSSRSSKDQVLALTDGYGVDSVILTAGTSSNEPIELAGDIARERAKVVIVGAVKADIPRGTYYRKELEVIMSRSYGPGRYDISYEEEGNDYPYGYVRWTENRNMRAFLELVAKEKVNLKDLITHKFELKEFEKAYNLVLGKEKEFFRGILFKYADEIKSEEKIFKSSVKDRKLKKIVVGFIGAGSFAQSMLLPHLKDSDVTLHTVCNVDGLDSRNVAEKFKFLNFTTDVEQIFNNKEINTVFIATRHDTHGNYVLNALKNDKYVYVEKPLCIDYNELNEIKKYTDKNNIYLHVGFNRRFAKSVVEIKRFFTSIKVPFMFLFRVNAGRLPSSHWVQRPDQGGRIIGEVCHFIDTCAFICNSYPVSVFANSVSFNPGENKEDDNISTIIKFNDGSLATIIYQSNADGSLPKEYLEVSAGQKTAILHNFEKLNSFKQIKDTRNLFQEKVIRKR